MKLLSSDQIKKLDQSTIIHEPITSIDLMERAAEKMTHWIVNHFPDPNIPIHILCGPGNNGGDGFAIARLLLQYHRSVTVYAFLADERSRDAEVNFRKLPERGYLKIRDLKDLEDLPADEIFIDALFGSGLSRPLEGKYSEIVRIINDLDRPVVSVDIPSGLMVDQNSQGAIVNADYTLTLQLPKLSFFQRESATYVGRLAIIDIGLYPPAIREAEADNFYVTKSYVRNMIPDREMFDHKGTFGHALLICGGYGKVGAAILAARGCLRSGVGKLTVHVPKYAYQVMQVAVPEAMTQMDAHDYWFTQCDNASSYDVIGIGCGIGQGQMSARGLRQVLDATNAPILCDADALNILSMHKEWLMDLPKNSVITPHPGEFKRLFGSSKDSFDRLRMQKELSVQYGIFIVYKGAYTCTTSPSGQAFINSTGNPGMATAGSGDVLSGMITGLMAQGIDVKPAVIAGVYLHGLAGDLAASCTGQHALIASDIINHIGSAICKTKSQ